MQSTGSKNKRSRSKAEEPNTAAPTPVTAAEENTKSRRKTSSPKAAAEATPAAKQHRGAAKKSVNTAAEEKSAVAAPAKVSHADIATLAYSYWAERGYQGGSADEDWFRAERFLSSRS